LFDYETTSVSVFAIICILQSPSFIVRNDQSSVISAWAATRPHTAKILAPLIMGGARIFAVWGRVLAQPRVWGRQKEGIYLWHLATWGPVRGDSWGQVRAAHGSECLAVTTH